MVRTLRAAALLAALTLPAAAADMPLPVVAGLDLDQYMGRWHEIARYPNRFEKDCARDITATYTRTGATTVRVVNECTKVDGAPDRADGEARVVGPAQLEVRFAPAWLSWLPFVWGDYWVIELAADYRYAVVGEPGREYLWVLSREPVMSDADWQAATARLASFGYDAGKLVRNPIGPR